MKIDIGKISQAHIRKKKGKARWKAKRLARTVGVPEGFTVVMPCSNDRKWIVDSGSCFDIVNTNELRPGEKKNTTMTQRPYRMITAAGIVKADRETIVPLANTGRKATAIIMNDSPCVLSLGKRCMQEGFSFEWNAGENPTLVTPEGHVTHWSYRI